MHYLSEQVVRQVVSQADVTAAIESMYVAIARGDAVNFPTVRETLGYAGAVFGFKSGVDRSAPMLGVKAGGFWPGNQPRGLANHQSTVMLFDPDTGQPSAVVRGNYLTALRTAAASAISIKYLARESSEVLGIVGAGGQAEYQVRAALEVGSFRRVLISDTDFAKARMLASNLADLDIDCVCEDAEALVRGSDVVITITPAKNPVVRACWLRAGIHVACMGADTRGKQELETASLQEAKLFVDDKVQSVSIGEFQHAYRDGLVTERDLAFIGDVINGAAGGRDGEQQITVFDSSGIGLQDIYAAQLALDRAAGQGFDTRFDFDRTQQRRALTGNYSGS